MRMKREGKKKHSQPKISKPTFVHERILLTNCGPQAIYPFPVRMDHRYLSGLSSHDVTWQSLSISWRFGEPLAGKVKAVVQEKLACPTFELAGRQGRTTSVHDAGEQLEARQHCVLAPFGRLASFG